VIVDDSEHSPDLILASSSPRRRELIEQLGLRPLVMAADIDETPRVAEDPGDYVLRLSHGKAQKIAAQQDAVAIVLGADTIIDHGGQVLGKPENQQQCIDMLSQLAATTHQVLTGVTVIRGEQVESTVISTEVGMREISVDEIRAYWQTGEPQGKAGSYAIQGRGARFVTAINGSYSNVVGLPLFETADMLSRFGIEFDRV
jgi:septum formation protein